MVIEGLFLINGMRSSGFEKDPNMDARTDDRGGLGRRNRPRKTPKGRQVEPQALAEVCEVATFYAHFDVVKEDETPPPALTVRVCDSLSCAMAGAEHLLRTLPNRLGPDVRVVRAPCMGACDRAPVCAVGHVQVMGA